MSVFRGSSLLEADPSANYERAVRDFAQEMIAAGRSVFVLTSRGSPVQMLLREEAAVRFFIFADVSYPKSSGAKNETLVPQNDRSVLLNVIDEAVTEPRGTAKAMVFDNISSMILDSGFQETYKFLRQVNEIITRGDVVLLSIVLSKAHDDKMMNIVRNMFSTHLSFDATGMHVMKQ